MYRLTSLALATLAALLLVPDASDARCRGGGGRFRHRERTVTTVRGSCSTSCPACRAPEAAPEPIPVKPRPNGYSTTSASGADDALAEVNAARAARGLRPFLRDDGLTQAARWASRHRARYLIEGHTDNDFWWLPDGCSATAAGCAAWEPGLGWGSCCTYEGHTYAGAAWCLGSDGRRYMHIFVR